MRGATTKDKCTSIWDRWQNGAVYRASHLSHNWTDEWAKYFDFIAHFDISHDAPHWQRARYNNMINLRKLGLEQTRSNQSSCESSRQDKTTAPLKARSHQSHSTTKKCLVAFEEMNSSQSETALCSAVLAQSGTDAIVSMIPWPERLDGPSESAGLAARKKTLRKETIADRILNFVCKLKLFTSKSKKFAPLRSVSLVASQVLIIILHFE